MIWVVIALATIGLSAAAGTVRLWDPIEPSDSEPEAVQPAPEPDRRDGPDRDDPISPPSFNAPDFLNVLAVIVTLAAFVAYGRSRWYVPRRHRRQRRGFLDGEFADPTDAALLEAMRDSAVRAEAVLGQGEADDAVVRCWQILERDMSELGIRPLASETSAEFVERLLRRVAIDSSAVTRLAQLYREARFSEHQLGEPERRQAVEALRAVVTDTAVHEVRK